jgi:hypothetical protein
LLPPPPEYIIARFGLQPFYKQYIDAGGLPVLGSDKPSAEALREAAWIVSNMLATRGDVRNTLFDKKVRIVVMACIEHTTDVPEHATLPEEWNCYRGVGPTLERPVCSCAEENLLCLPSDCYDGQESILIHEFAHAIHTMALNTVDPGFDERLRAAYRAAMEKGLWQESKNAHTEEDLRMARGRGSWKEISAVYAAKNPKEYWAEGVQAYFDAGATSEPIHNHIGTREELAEYDSVLYRLIDEVFYAPTWRYESYIQRRSARNGR